MASFIILGRSDESWRCFAEGETGIFSGRRVGARYLMNRQKFCLYTRNVKSYIILSMRGEALPLLVTNDISLFSNKLAKGFRGHPRTGNFEISIIVVYYLFQESLTKN